MMIGKLLRSALAVLLLLSLGLVPRGVPPAGAVADTWVTQDSGITNQVTLTGVAAADANTAWIVGSGPTILKTINGTAWAPQNPPGGTIPTTSFLNGVDTADVNTAWIVGQTSLAWDQGVSSSSRGTILYTNNGGTTWTHQNSGTGADLLAVSAVDTANVWAVGANGVIVRTVNGGATWGIQNIAGVTTRFNGVAAVDYYTAWVVGEFGSIYRTVDGGANWTLQSSPSVAVTLNGIAAVNSNIAWAVGMSGAVLKTTNGGGTGSGANSGWVQQFTSAASQEFKGVAAVDGTTAWIVGSGTTILKTANGGSLWESQVANTNLVLRSVAIGNASATSSVWAVGDALAAGGGLNNTIYKTSLTAAPPVGTGNVLVNFSISVLLAQLCVVIDTPVPANINYGTMLLGSTAVSGVISARNCGTTLEDFLIQGADATATAPNTNWVLDETVPIEAGADIYVHSYGDGGTFAPLKKTTTTALASAIPATTGIKSFYTQVKTPTSTTGSGTRNTTVTITATQ